MIPIKYIALGWLVITAVAFSSFTNKKPVTNTEKGFAVVELFTSEGCSSCPPADAVIAKIEKESTDKPIYILAFHVDYWNRLGWKDVFSSADYSHRQQQYASWLHLQSVYTPQVVVNGHTEFVGSEEGTLRNTIKTNLEKTPAANLTLSNIKTDGGKISVQYHTQGNATNDVLLLAVVEKHAQSKVERGENSGRTLSHVQIVRALASAPVKAGEGNASIALPKGFDAKGYELIAFLQNPANGEISGAAKATF
jgi:hypothetical protein